MYAKVLMSIDLHEDKSWKKALPTAVKICETFGAELHLLTVVPELPQEIGELYLSHDKQKGLVESAHDAVGKFAKEHAGSNIKIVPHVGMGSVYHVICDKAIELGCDLIVMGAHRPQMSDYLLGPNAARVVRHAKCSVMVVRD